MMSIQSECKKIWNLPADAQDPLTHCYNRSAFCEKAREMIDSHEPGFYILSCVNIDDFKVINDQYGTEIGDQVLCHVADSISECLADIGGICARFAADDFAILFPASYEETPRIVAAHMRACTPRCILQRIHVRIGRCHVEEISLSVAALYDRAKLATDAVHGIYGKYIETYSESMREKLLRRRHILDSMGDALKNGEFEPWLQPQYNHATGAIIGAEALARWRKDGAYIPPCDFIPIFEESGFVYELDRYMWERVCVLLRRWMDEGREPLPISVNISRCDIAYDDFPQTLMDLVKKYDIPINLLRLEITESALAGAAQMVISKVGDLIRAGFTMEIDDFGSGYSSLNTLKEVPASVLKLDMRFFENTEDNRRAGSIIESVVRMAKWLDMAVIAEGVEKKTQADFLKSIGCYYIQGYYYARPMPIADYEALVLNAAKEKTLTRLKTISTFENEAFWDPESMDTLIFNSYIGGACIFEYRNGGVDILRINDQFVAQFNGMVASDARLRRDHLMRCISAEDARLLCDAIERAGSERREQSGELCAHYGDQTEYIRYSIRVIARIDDRLLCYCAVRNLTEQRMAEQRAQESHARLQSIMNNICGGVLAVARTADGRYDIAFANDGFYRMIGYTKEQYDAEITSVEQIVLDEDRTIIDDAVRRCIAFKGEEMCEYRIRRRAGEIIWARMSVSVADCKAIGENVFIGVIMDITAEYTQRQQLIFLNESAHELLSQPEAAKAIEMILKKVLDFFGGDRAVIFEMNKGQNTVSNTYECCAEGIPSLTYRRQNIDYGFMLPWIENFQRNEPIIVNQVSDLLSSQIFLRDGMIEHGVHSLVAAPMLLDGRLIGFIGTDNPSHSTDWIFQLTALGDYAALLIRRRELNRQINWEKDLTNDIANALPGGFVRLKPGNGGNMELIYASRSMERMTGYSIDALRDLFRDGLYACVVSEDRPIVDALIKDIRCSGVGVGRYRARCRNGVCMGINTSVRATNGSDGEQYYNIYYTDTTEEMHEEDLRHALLDNLPTGAAMFEYYTDGRMNTLYLNQRMNELLGRDPNTPTGSFSSMEGLHPDDRAAMLKEAYDAITQGRNGVCVSRFRHSDGGYRLLQVNSRFVPKSDGGYLIYSTYRPVGDESNKKV